jgi:hypothetical protein
MSTLLITLWLVCGEKAFVRDEFVPDKKENGFLL